MGEIGDLIQAHKDAQRYRVSSAQIAKAVGVSRQTVANWIAGEAMPTPDNLRALARAIEAPYSRVLDAALVDNGYLPKEREGRGQHQPAAIAATESDAVTALSDSGLPTAVPKPPRRGRGGTSRPG